MAVVLLIVGYGENRWLHSELRARRDEVRYQINSNLSQARDSRRTENLLDARISVDRARLAAALEPESFLSVERRYFTWRIDREEARVDELFRAHPAADLDLHRGCRFDAGPLVRDLTALMQRLFTNEQYFEAWQTAAQLLLLDPSNAEASAIIEVIEMGLGIEPPFSSWESNENHLRNPGGTTTANSPLG